MSLEAFEEKATVNKLKMNKAKNTAKRSVSDLLDSELKGKRYL
jgi:hypothetical protein